MQKNVTLLGYSPLAASIIFDTLYACYQQALTITTVHNIDPKTIKPYPFEIDGIEHQEFWHEQWQPNSYGNYFLGTISPKIKKIIFEFFQKHYGIDTEQFISIIHPSHNKAHTAEIKEGVLVSPGTTIGPYSTINRFVTINRHVSVGHHTHIGEFSNLQPACNIAGLCNIGKNVAIGMGANIIDKVTIGDNSVIGAGALVTKSIPENCVAYGVPAKIIREVPLASASAEVSA